MANAESLDSLLTRDLSDLNNESLSDIMKALQQARMVGNLDYDTKQDIVKKIGEAKKLINVNSQINDAIIESEKKNDVLAKVAEKVIKTSTQKKPKNAPTPKVVDKEIPIAIVSPVGSTKSKPSKKSKNNEISFGDEIANSQLIQESGDTSTSKVKKVPKNEELAWFKAENKRIELENEKARIRNQKEKEKQKKILEEAKLYQQKLHDEAKLDELEMQTSARLKAEKQRTRRIKLSNETKEELAQKHIDLAKEKLKETRAKNRDKKLEREYRERLQKEAHANSERIREERRASYERKKLDAEANKNEKIKNSKLKQQENLQYRIRQQTKNALSVIHPSLGSAYDYIKTKQEQKRMREENDGNSLTSSVVGGASASIALATLAKKESILKLAKSMAGSKLGIVSGLIFGGASYLQSGSVGKGLAVGGGAVAGSVAGSIGGGMVGRFAGGLIGGLLGGPAGAIIGQQIGASVGSGIFGLIGMLFGETQAKQWFDSTSENPQKGSQKDSNGYVPFEYSGRFDDYARNARNKANGWTPSGTRINPEEEKRRPKTQQELRGIPLKPLALGEYAKKEFLAGISSGESTSPNTIYGGGQADLTNMTVSEVQQFQKNASNFPKNSPSRAVGKHQMTIDMLDDELKKQKIDPSTKFTEDVQDSIYLNRLRRVRKLDAFLSGKISKEAFNTELAKETASIPVMRKEKSKYTASGVANPGQSYYHGYKGNKAIKSVESMNKLLDNLFISAQKAPSKIANLETIEDSMNKTKQANKTKPTNVIVQNSSNMGGGTTIVNNVSHYAPKVDATIRDISTLVMLPGRIL